MSTAESINLPLKKKELSSNDESEKDENHFISFHYKNHVIKLKALTFNKILTEEVIDNICKNFRGRKNILRPEIYESYPMMSLALQHIKNYAPTSDIQIINLEKTILPYPIVPSYNSQEKMESISVIPTLAVSKQKKSLVLAWKMKPTQRMVKAEYYELYICQIFPNTPWRKISNIQADNVPMIYQVTNLEMGNEYMLALRMVDQCKKRSYFGIQKIST